MPVFRLLLLLSFFVQTALALPQWKFNDLDILSTWVPNAECADAAVSGDSLKLHTIGSDPFLQCDSINLQTTPWQYVRIRIKADKSGMGDFFWTGDTSGQYGGLTENKKSRFLVQGKGEWENICIVPGWHTEGKILKLRLDLYDHTQFEIQEIEVVDWAVGKTPLNAFPEIKNNQDLASWSIVPGCEDYYAPPLNITSLGQDWFNLRMKSPRAGVASVLWMCGGERGLQAEEFTIKGDGQFHTYSLALGGIPSWRAPIVAFGLRLPREIRKEATIERLTLNSGPAGPPDIEISYLGFENGVNRVGRFCNLLGQIRNVGGDGAAPMTATVEFSQAVHANQEDCVRLVPGIKHGEQQALLWTLRADRPGDATASLVVEYGTQTASHEVTLRFEPKVDNGYPAPPKPVKSSIDLCIYYFPGWDNDAKWDCIRRVAPIRKPLLGYYDESNPECVDWQIKWARENGINCFLVDWYWCKGHQILNHWFDAYRKARYRDQLQVAIMWANHNPPGNHSAEDWRNVTHRWIEQYFNLPSYYKIDGKPAVFIWDPKLIREDLGSSEAVRAIFEESQNMAREAGYSGITYVAMHHHDSPSQAQTLLEEGYAGATNYHEFGTATEAALSMTELRYSDVAATVPSKWAERDEMCGKLTYFPVVDSGWDPRPWHGYKSMILRGRTPALFGDLLKKAKAFADEKHKPLVVLGPANEWGEGSYLEPCTEYGFEMYEMVREVFAEGDPETWPVNLGPADLGLGPYDFIPPLVTDSWSFTDGPEGWTPMMNTGEFRCGNGALRTITTSSDPALTVSTPGLSASRFTKALVKMQMTGSHEKESSAQLFWAAQGSPVSLEAYSVRFPVKIDGRIHEYMVDLTTNPHWSGRISSLRFDPCDDSDVEVVIEEFRFMK